MIGISASLDTSGLEQFTENFRREAEKVVLMTAFNIEGDAKIETPVDTGALRASIYTVTMYGNGYERAIAEAESVYWSNKIGQDTSVGMPLSPRVPEPASPLVAVVAVGMAYGIYVEFGTDRMAARPFMLPAADRNRSFFATEMAKAVAKAARDAGAR
jgi:HK97 gp10 family phage protein